MHGSVGIRIEFLFIVAPAVCDVVSVRIQLPVAKLIAPLGQIERTAVKFILPAGCCAALRMQQRTLQERQVGGIQSAVAVLVGGFCLLRRELFRAEQPVTEQPHICALPCGVRCRTAL